MREQGQTSCRRPTHTFSSIATVAERLVTLLGYANRREKGKSMYVGLSVSRQLSPLHSGNSLANTERIVGARGPSLRRIMIPSRNNPGLRKGGNASCVRWNRAVISSPPWVERQHRHCYAAPDRAHRLCWRRAAASSFR